MDDAPPEAPPSRRKKRIAYYEQKLQQQKERERQVLTRQRYLASARARKDDTRRKILLGSVMLVALKDDLDPASREVIRDILDRRLTRNADRALFHLPPLASAPQPLEPPSQKTPPTSDGPIPHAWLDEYLNDELDRALFDLPPR